MTAPADPRSPEVERLQAAVERAKAAIRRDGTDGAQPVTNILIEEGFAYYERTFVYGYLSAQQDVDETWNAAVRACAEQIGGPPEDPGEFENWSTNDGDVDDHARLSARWHARERVLSLLRPTPHHASPHE